MPKSSQNDPKVIPKWPLSNPQVTPVTFMTCMSCMSCMHFMHVMHACHASLAPELNLGHVPPAQSVPWRRISDAIFEPWAKDLSPLEAILLNCLPPAVIVGLAHPYRQHQCFRGLWRSIERDSGAILSKKGHQCASCSIRPWEMSFLTPFSIIISPN